MTQLADRLAKDFASRDDLPALPSVAARLLGTLARDHVHMSEIAEIVLQDPAIAAQVLRAANSASLSGRIKIGTISEALPRLGVLHLRRLAMIVCARTALPVDAATFPHEAFWAHSLGVAHGAEIVLKRLGHGAAETMPEVLFLAGLMHDIGLLAVACFYPEEYRAFVREAEARNAAFYRGDVAETCSEVGSVLATHWMLPDAMVSAIRWHHQPRRAEQEHRWTVRVVHLAEHLAHRALGGFPHGAAGYDEATAVTLGVESSAAFRMCSEIRAEARRTAFTWLGPSS